MLTTTQIAGFAGAGLAGAAYIPQISHLIRARCSAGISRLAFAVWLLASLLITVRALAIHAGVFIVLGGIQIVATTLIMISATRYKNTPCPIHHPRPPGATTATATGTPANEPDSWPPAGRSIAESSTFQESCENQRLPSGAMMSGGWHRRPRRPGPHAQAGTRARVVIVGAGFGGLECARTLDGAAVDVLLLDRGGYHLFTPLLYQVATALLNPSEVAYPLRASPRTSASGPLR